MSLEMKMLILWKVRSDTASKFCDDLCIQAVAAVLGCILRYTYYIGHVVSLIWVYDTSNLVLVLHRVPVVL